MGNTDRLYRIEMLIRNRKHISFDALMEELEVSRATLKRDLAYLRDRLGAPIEYDRFLGGYTFGEELRGDKHELPGLWFNESELYALLMAHQLLSDLDENGVLNRHLQPMLDRIHGLLGQDRKEAADLIKRVRILAPAKRPVPSQWFERVADALINRRRLNLRYLTRSRGQSSDRVVSPQRLVHYRATWYLDAYCHRVDGLRRFALDAIEEARVLEEKSREIGMRQVESAMDAGYGIYAGDRQQWATLLFDADAAQWISKEEWHPQQVGKFRPDGRYELRLPYVEETEIIMDVLRHGAHVEVLAPKELRARCREQLKAAQALYSK